MSAFQRIFVISGDRQPLIQAEIHQWTLNQNGFYIVVINDFCTITVRVDNSATIQYFDQHGNCVDQFETTWSHFS